MTIEHVLTDEQKEDIMVLWQEILDRYMKILSISGMTKVRYTAETEDEKDMLRKYFSLGQQYNQGIVRMRTGDSEKEEHDERAN